MLTREDIEEILSKHPFLRPPKFIYVLESPVIYPRLRALVFGINPAYERRTIILSSDATKETLIHETLHRMGIGEILAGPLAKRIAEFRERRQPIFQKRVRYKEKTLSSRELERYGLRAYERVNKYVPTELKIKVLELI